MLTRPIAIVIWLLALASGEAKRLGAKREIIKSRNGPGGYTNGTSADNGAVALSISTLGGGRNATAPLLYGWQFEDINVRIF